VEPQKRPAQSQATTLIELAECGECWHNPDGAGFITLPVNDHREHLPIRGPAFKQWWQREYFTKTKAACNAQAIQDAIGVLEGKARHEGPEYPVFVRLAEHDGSIYIDLCDAGWRVVEITSVGWQVRNDSPVKFRRCKAMHALPEPATGGDVDELRQNLGLRDDSAALVMGWMAAALRPSGPFPVLNFYAEQGAGKTTAARKIRLLIDPNTAPMRSEPKDPRDLMIAANNGWIIALDNLSRIPGWLSDTLCRLSTGGGFSTRTLYENDEETIFDAKRPIIITGIEELATRGDLLDRSLIVTLPAIPEDERRSEDKIWREFNEAQPRLFGVLCDAASMALRNLPNINLDRLPRMADFARWATAAEPAIGLQPGEFMEIYAGNRAEGNELAIESNPVGKVVLDFMDDTSNWTGTATDLLANLDEFAGEKTKQQQGWPKSAQGLSGILKRLAPHLRAVGVDAQWPTRTKNRRCIILRKVGESCVTTVTTPEDFGNSAEPSDASVTDEWASVTQETPGNAASDAGDDGFSSYPELTPEEGAALDEFTMSDG
jgi:hypothetical protein